MTANRYGVSLGGDKHVLKLDGGDGYITTLWICFKTIKLLFYKVNFIIYKLYISIKLLFKRERVSEVPMNLDLQFFFKNFLIFLKYLFKALLQPQKQVKLKVRLWVLVMVMLNSRVWVCELQWAPQKGWKQIWIPVRPPAGSVTLAGYVWIQGFENIKWDYVYMKICLSEAKISLNAASDGGGYSCTGPFEEPKSSQQWTSWFRCPSGTKPEGLFNLGTLKVAKEFI